MRIFGELNSSWNLPESLTITVCVPSCFVFCSGAVISKSAIKTRAVIRQSAPSTAALSTKSFGIFSIDANVNAPTIPNRITPSPSRQSSLRKKEKLS